MRHGVSGRKLNRTTSHRLAMFRNMVTSLLQHERIFTTLPKAKELRRWADWMISLGKRGDLHARRLALAKQLGFRVILYFGDGVIQDSKSPAAGCYHPDWDYQDAKGKRVTGWEGPDTWGTTYVRNPSHPEVVAWYGRYLKALLDAFGPEIDSEIDALGHRRG